MSTSGRTAEIRRETSETRIAVEVNIDGTGEYAIKTGVGFFDHMLEQLARHGLFDLKVAAEGDLHIDDHHTVEDVGIALGQAFDKALGERRGITRYASMDLPMDEARTNVAVDVSGRPFLVWRSQYPTAKIGTFDTELVREWFQAFSQHARMTIHVETAYGENSHHIAESSFKALARALRAALSVDQRAADAVPSTKGTLTC